MVVLSQLWKHRRLVLLLEGKGSHQVMPCKDLYIWLLLEGAAHTQGGRSTLIKATMTVLQVRLPTPVILVCGKLTLRPAIMTCTLELCKDSLDEKVKSRCQGRYPSTFVWKQKSGDLGLERG